ncbi:hypothetical protein [Streptomyces sp. SP17KL33]|uniref:hypothetical protein n=1 Tax=Streptomyces sp. SP17KL33 TaxID=3002534 RepID=UPI002E7A7878|nr:hypothetical protein [Streptomyces sp. SP17KL33]MEE1837214.1 hypothetical protein [Streptomyces sp. SP17KL33]
MTAFELADKVVLITGGILSRGARVGIVDLRPDTSEIAAGIPSPHVVGFAADARDRSALDDTIACRS